MRGDAGFPVRVRFAKRGPIRFISHRDVARAMERALRIEELPLAFTRGFSPRPKVSFGPALAVGHESDAEYLDVELTTEVDVDALPPGLCTALPEGLDVTGATALADRAPALQESITVVAYRVEVIGPGDGTAARVAAVAARIDRALASSNLEVARVRKGADVVEDIRPALRHLGVVGETTGGVLLEMELSTQPRGTRPGDVVAALGTDVAEERVLRTHQWIERGGARLEPLEADPRPRVVIEARAS